MSEKVHSQIDEALASPEDIALLAYYGECLVTGTLPVIDPSASHAGQLESHFHRFNTWQEHNMSLRLSGLMVGSVQINMIEGLGTRSLNIDIHYLYPHRYLISSRVPASLTAVQLRGQNIFMIDGQTLGAVAHVQNVYEGGSAPPLWAATILDFYRQSRWPVVRSRRAADAVTAFQAEVNRQAVHSLTTFYDEVAEEYGLVTLKELSVRTPFAA